MTYARARLWTGIGGVGTLVLLAVALLLAYVPARLLEGRGSTLASDAALLFAVLGCAALVLLPFDVLGGLVLPRRFGRPAPSAARFAASWLRGVLVLLSISALSGTLLLAAGRAGGRPLALVAFVVFALGMLALQEPIARLVGGLRRVRGAEVERLGLGPDVILLRGSDPAFSGGFAGFAETSLLSERWVRALEPDALAILVERRRLILGSGVWRRTLVLALAWNAGGFTLASLLPGAGVRSAAELVATALGFTLWTFVGLLLLPTPSRRATLHADALVARDGSTRGQLAGALAIIDKFQDDEPERSAGLESIFHPVPSLASRIRAWTSAEPQRAGAWHLARTALYMSHAGLSLLPRAVHCNVGRPELWVYLPGDG